MIHSQETQKLLEALVAFVPEDQRPAFGDAAHKFLDSLTLDYEAEFMDEAGPQEIDAFGAAATALAPLNSEMRDRTLRALRALLLERGPTPLEKIADAFIAAAPQLAEMLKTAPFVAPVSGPARDRVEPYDREPYEFLGSIMGAGDHYENLPRSVSFHMDPGVALDITEVWPKDAPDGTFQRRGGTLFFVTNKKPQEALDGTELYALVQRFIISRTWKTDTILKDDE